MMFEEEKARLDAKYKDLMETEDLTSLQKRQIKELRKKLEGQLYDPKLLFDWIENIPFEGVFDSGWEGHEKVLNVVGVIVSYGMRDFYYVGYDQDGKMYLMLCNDRHEKSKGNIFKEISIETMRRDIKRAMFPDDVLLVFKTNKNDKTLVK